MTAADIYEGVGQLVLYSRMLGLHDDRRILLLPGQPGPALMNAARDERLMVLAYDYMVQGKS